MGDDRRNGDNAAYEKPAVETEEVFETLALTCTKADSQCLPPGGSTTLRS